MFLALAIANGVFTAASMWSCFQAAQQREGPWGDTAAAVTVALVLLTNTAMFAFLWWAQ